MGENTLRGTIVQSVKDFHEMLFSKDWPAWIAGILLAFLAIGYVIWDYPWGVVGGFRNWGDWFFYLIGMNQDAPGLTPIRHGYSMSNFGILLGTFAAALLTRRFRLNIQPGFEYVKAIVGGAMMGFGAILAAGCNIGGYYIAIATFSGAGFAMMVGMIIGTNLALKYLLWEMEHIPSKSKKQPAAKEGGIDWKKVQPWLGFILFLGLVGSFILAGYTNNVRAGGYLFLGTLVGVVMYRSRLCFVASFRDFFMTGDTIMLRGVMIAMALTSLGMALFLYKNPGAVNIYPAFWFGGIVGGTIFGFGMTIAGGCGSSSLWRSGEGNTKLWVTLVPFILFSSYFHPIVKNWTWFNPDTMPAYINQAVDLTKIFSWPILLTIYLLFFAFIAIVGIWNEKTEKFVIF